MSEDISSFLFVCPQCGEEVELPEAFWGMPYTCKQCSHQTVAKGQQQKECPWCGELIKAKAKICRFCQRNVTDTAQIDQKQSDLYSGEMLVKKIMPHNSKSNEACNAENEQAWHVAQQQGLQFSADKTMLLKCPDKNIKSVVIPEGVTTIGHAAFFGCALESVQMPASMTTIEQDAFSWCSSLENVVIPEGVTTIEDAAFISCKKLQSVEIPESVTEIESYTFAYCTNLERVKIPRSIAKIGPMAFEGCRCEGYLRWKYSHLFPSFGEKIWKMLAHYYDCIRWFFRVHRHTLLSYVIIGIFILLFCLMYLL